MIVPPFTPDEKASNEESGIDAERLQIRIVPYSPPRISFDDLRSPRLASNSDSAVSTPSHSILSRPHDAYTVYPTPTQEISAGSDHHNFTGNDSDGQSVAENDDLTTSAPNWMTTSGPSVPSSPTSSYRRPRRIITVNSDKTFSLVAQTDQTASAGESLRTPRRSSTTPSSSVDQAMFDPLSEVLPASPLTILEELTPSPSSSCSGHIPDLSSSLTVAGTTSSSTWNHEFVGGLRKVPDSSGNPCGKETSNGSAPAASAPQQAVFISPLTNIIAGNSPLTANGLFHSSQSTLSDSFNIRTFAGNSPHPTGEHHSNSDAASLENSGRSHVDSNFEIIGESSSEQSLNGDLRPESNDSHDQNYELHSDIQPSSPSLLPSSSYPKEKYSKESLVVAPLRPAKKPLKAQFQASTQRHLESTPTSSTTSLYSIANEDERNVLFAGTLTMLVAGNFRDNLCRRSMSFAAPENRHLSSTPLSTVFSEGERSSQVPSLSLSRSTFDNSRSVSHAHRLNSSPLLSAHPDQSLEACLDIPQPINGRGWSREANSSSTRLIQNQDEHGDGLAELEELHRRPSRPGLHNYLSSCHSDISLRSSSTRSNSFSRSYIPAWARLYYGGGERRFLSIQRSTESLSSQFNNAVLCRIPSSTSISPSVECSNAIGQTIPKPPRIQSATGPPSLPASDIELCSNEIRQQPSPTIIRHLKKQTSSIWSPHLHRDRRAHGFYMWRPPSSKLVASDKKPSRTNIQIVLFVLGFIFPFAWMAASVLPLSPAAQSETTEKSHSTSHLNLEQGLDYQATETDPTHYNRAKWWRNLNRSMSIIGILVIGAAIALIITGTRQQWASKS